MTPIVLKNTWCNAIVNPAVLSTTKLARTAVIVVPILAPSVMGNAFCMDSMPEPTIGTSIDVVILELWTEKVIRIPIKIANSPPPLASALSKPISIWFIINDFIFETTFFKQRKINPIAMTINKTA